MFCLFCKKITLQLNQPAVCMEGHLLLGQNYYYVSPFNKLCPVVN